MTTTVRERVLRQSAASSDGPAGGMATDRRSIVSAAVLAAAVAAATSPLLPVYESVSAAVAVVAGVTLGAALAVVAARRSAFTVIVGTILVYLVAGGPLAAPSTTLGSVIPTAGTVTGLVRALIDVWKQALTLQPPFGSAGTLLALPFVIALVGSTAAVSLAVRLPRRLSPLAALVVVGCQGVALLFANRQTFEPGWTAAATVTALLVWVGWQRGTLRPRRLLSVLLVVGAVVAGSVVIGPELAASNSRYVLRDRISAPFDPHDRPSPLAAFRSFVKERKDEDLFTVTGLPTGARIRLATLDAYDGVVWNVAPVGTASGSGTFRRVGERISTGQHGTRAHVDVQIQGLRGLWLPTVGQATGIAISSTDPQLEAEQLRYNSSSGVALLTDGVTGGLRYSLDVVVPDVPTPEQLDAAQSSRISLPGPVGVPESLTLLASQVAGSATSPALIAQALTDTLSQQGWFSHGITEAGDYPSLSGHGADRMASLVGGDLMVGDQEQYAAALALMARSMGLPARVVVGFVPSDTQGSTVTVTGADISAWVEIAYAGYGWVAYDPTPDASRTPQQDAADDAGQGQPLVVQPPAPPADPVQPPDDDTERARTSQGERDSSSLTDAGSLLPRPVVVGLATGGGLLLVWLIPVAVIVAAKVRRRRRRRRAAPAEQAAGAWDELVDVARDARAAPSGAATRSEAADQVAALLAARRRGGEIDGLADDLAGAARATDALVFGRAAPTAAVAEDHWVRLTRIADRIMVSLPRRRRLLARVSPRSLRSRGRG